MSAAWCTISTSYPGPAVLPADCMPYGDAQITPYGAAALLAASHAHRVLLRAVLGTLLSTAQHCASNLWCRTAVTLVSLSHASS